jgi:hypothetical protein
VGSEEQLADQSRARPTEGRQQLGELASDPLEAQLARLGAALQLARLGAALQLARLGAALPLQP